jgi:anti-anti-sigma factor
VRSDFPAPKPRRPIRVDSGSHVNTTLEVEILSSETAIVALGGEHDLGTRDRLADALTTARVSTTVIVDFSECTFVDSFVLTSVMRGWRDQLDAGGNLAIVAGETHVRRTIELMGIDAFIPLHATRAEALAALTPRRHRRLRGVSVRIDEARLRRAA